MSIRYPALVCAALLLLCGGCTTAQPGSSSPPALSVPDVSAPEISVPETPAPKAPPIEPSPKRDPDPVTPAPEPSAPPAEATDPIGTVPTPTVDIPAGEVPGEMPSEVPIEPDVPTVHIPDGHFPLTGYDFSAPVPESAPVSAEYFADAAFVGDSRTEGFWLYSGIKQGKLLCATGLTVFSVNSKTAINSSQTVLQALNGGSFGKIYLSLGINELGYIDTDAFIQSYCELIDTIRAAHPDAVIYIQNLIPVNDAKAHSAGHQGHVNCDRIRLYNEFLAQIAQEKQIPLLDLYSAFAVDGQLPAGDSRDGIHLLPAACKRQLNYLMTHTVTPTAPAPEVPAPDPQTETEATEI